MVIRLIAGGVLLAGLTLLADIAAAAKSTRVVDREYVPLTRSDSTPLTLAETKAAIVAGATSLGWRVVESKSDTLTLELQRERYSVTLDAHYTAGMFSLYYVDSQGLNFRESGERRSIHSSYRRWIENLVGQITRAAYSTDLRLQPVGEKPD